MKTRCIMCLRETSQSTIDWLMNKRAMCPASEVQSCIETFTALFLDPPDEDPPLAPESRPPLDINVCPRCGGMGEVFLRKDWGTGAHDFTTCPACGGVREVTPEWQAPLTP